MLKRRVERSIRRTPNCSSSSATRRLILDFGKPSARAAAENPSCFTTAAKK
ncbi:hypothetical protein [Bradyrhizobium sp. 186]|uniref:hypothetical protein n=1 Tax=Bradyrhizobium sp. 186 TaxID=2782654 RepID=UPI00200129FD|nr:hypothetical protein [Bradyrhizobium sp. 186]